MTENKISAEKPKTARFSNQMIAILVVIAVAICALAYFVFYNSTGHKLKYNYSASTMEPFSIPATANDANNGLKFSRPRELTLVLSKNRSTGPYSGIATMSQSKNDPSKTVLSWLGAAVAETYGGAKIPSHIKFLDETLGTPKAAGYNASVDRIKSYAQVILPKDYSLNFGTPGHFRNSKITKDAWQFDLSAKSKSQAEKDQSSHPEMQGKLILAMTEHADYYFVLTAVKQNWQSNSNTWQQVLSSIQIDQ